MAGLNLTQAVRNYQQGVQFSQQQEVTERQLAEMRRQDAIQQDVQSTFQQGMQGLKEKWAASGAPIGSFRPTDDDMLGIGDQVSMAYVKHGDINGFMSNEAKLQAQRTRVRHTALQKYALDGDAMGLVRSTVPTLVPGVRVTGVEVLGGAGQGEPSMPGAAPTGETPRAAEPGPGAMEAGELTGGATIGNAAAAPPGTLMQGKADAPARSMGEGGKIRVKLDNGGSKDFPLDQYLSMLKLADVDPAAAAKQEMEFRLKAALSHIQKLDDMEKERVKTQGALQVEGARAGHAKELESQKAKSAEALREAQDAAAETRTRISAGATLGAAQTSADARVKAAEIGAGGKKGTDAKAAEDRLKVRKRVNDEVTRFVGDPSNNLMGIGGRISNAATDEITDQLLKAYDEEGADPARNITAAVKGYFAARKPAPAPK